MSPGLKEGALAPAFTLPFDTGKVISLKSLRGQWVVLYFYPEDDTPTCTQQACDLRDGWAPLKKLGATVLGVSPDGVASHRAFRAKFKLPFPLLADEDHEVATAYGAWGKKVLYGNTFIGMHRNAVLIDPEGRIARLFPSVRTKGFAGRMAKAIGELQG